MRGRLDREYDMKIQPLSFAISDPAKAPEESQLEAKNCKVVKKQPNRDLCTAVMCHEAEKHAFGFICALVSG